MRNFGVTGRSALSGAQQPPTGPHYGANSTRTDSNVIYLPAACPSLRQPDSRAADFNLGAGFFFLAVILLPWVIVGGLTIGYLLFVG